MAEEKYKETNDDNAAIVQKDGQFTELELRDLIYAGIIIHDATEENEEVPLSLRKLLDETVPRYLANAAKKSVEDFFCTETGEGGKVIKDKINTLLRKLVIETINVK